jgi:acyl carrier protein
MKTEQEVVDIIIDILLEINPDSDLKSLDENQFLKEQLGMDSMDLLDIVMQLKKKHSLDIPQADYVNLATLRLTIDYLMKRFNDEGV